MSALYAAGLSVLGAALIVAGIACIYWPAALVAAGGLLVTFGLTVDTN